MIATTALTVEGAYYFIDTFGPEDKNDPIIKAGGLTPAQKEVGKGQGDKPRPTFNRSE